mgnify:CR=1 FL=1
MNAYGPWVNTINLQANEDGDTINLVKGSHLVFNKLFEHDSSYFLLGNDGRIIFLIPFQEDFTLVGTTEVPHEDIMDNPKCSSLEKEYLIGFVNQYFNFDLKLENIVWSYSGIRPLYKDSKKKKGSGEPNREKVATVTWDQIKKIAEDKMVDLNAFTVESAMNMVAGTARSMGIKVNGGEPPVN